MDNYIPQYFHKHQSGHEYLVNIELLATWILLWMHHMTYVVVTIYIDYTDIN